MLATIGNEIAGCQGQRNDSQTFRISLTTTITPDYVSDISREKRSEYVCSVIGSKPKRVDNEIGKRVYAEAEV